MKKMNMNDVIWIWKLTGSDVNDGSDVALLTDDVTTWYIDGVHAVDDLADLAQFQILHEIVVQNGRLDQLTWPNLHISKRETGGVNFHHLIYGHHSSLPINSFPSPQVISNQFKSYFIQSFQLINWSFASIIYLAVSEQFQSNFRAISEQFQSINSFLKLLLLNYKL